MAALDRLFTFLINQGGSDLHLGSNAKPMIRVNGDMVPINMDPLTEAQVSQLLLEIMPPRNQVEFQGSNDTDFAYELPGVARFRCNVYRDRKGPGGLFRQIPSKIVTADDPGLSGVIRDFCRLP
ncbi:MAG: type IV pilus twitching motility protein PilT, partial [Myxococcota bacterium]